NRDVILGDRDTILVAGFAAGSNLDRLAIRRLEISSGAVMSSRKKKKKKDRCPRSHGALARYRRAKVLQRRKGPSRTGVYALPGKAERSRQRRVSPPVCWLRPQASTNACELTGGFDDPGSVPVSKAFAAVMSCQKKEATTLSPSAVFGGKSGNSSPPAARSARSINVPFALPMQNPISFPRRATTLPSRAEASERRKKFAPGTIWSISRPPLERVNKTAPAPSLMIMPCPVSGFLGSRRKRHCR